MGPSLIGAICRPPANYRAPRTRRAHIRNEYSCKNLSHRIMARHELASMPVARHCAVLNISQALFCVTAAIILFYWFRPNGIFLFPYMLICGQNILVNTAHNCSRLDLNIFMEGKSTKVRGRNYFVGALQYVHIYG